MVRPRKRRAEPTPHDGNEGDEVEIVGLGKRSRQQFSEDLTHDDDSDEDADNEGIMDSTLPSIVQQCLPILFQQYPLVPKAVIVQATKQYVQIFPSETAKAVVMEAIATQLYLDGEIDQLPPEYKGAAENDIEIVHEQSSNPLNEILRVFPSAKASYVTDLLHKHDNDSEVVLNAMLEKGYEKEEPSASSIAPAPALPALDFTSTSWPTSPQYQAQGIYELSHNFPFLRTKSIEAVFKEKNMHYFPTFQSIEAECDWEGLLYHDPLCCATISQPKGPSKRRARAPKVSLLTPEAINAIRDTLREKKSQLMVLGTTRKGPGAPELITDPVLRQEVLWLRDRKRKELEEKDAQLAEQLNEQQAAEDGALLECGCCYSEYPFEKLIQCSEGHLFCKDCVRHYAEQVMVCVVGMRISWLRGCGRWCSAMAKPSSIACMRKDLHVQDISPRCC